MSGRNQVCPSHDVDLTLHIGSIRLSTLGARRKDIGGLAHTRHVSDRMTKDHRNRI